jgi:hypothetical protein
MKGTDRFRDFPILSFPVSRSDRSVARRSICAADAALSVGLFSPVCN